MPRFGLRIERFKVGKEFGVSDVEQMRGVIGHGILGSRDVVLEGQIVMMALMNGLHAKEISWRSDGGDRAFTVPEQGSNVVGVRFDGAFTDVKALNGGLVLEKAAGKLKVRVGDGAVAVLIQD
jgi:hypothetical protein